MINKYENRELLFFKFWNSRAFHDYYNYTILPGIKEGISGSVIGGHNVGINIYSNIKKRKEVVEVLKYITSKEMHKKYFIPNDILSSNSKFI